MTFTAVVAAIGYQGTPTGTVTFTIDGRAQPPVPLAVVGDKGEAWFVTSTLAAGNHTVIAAYSGDTNVNPRNGSLPTQTVTAPGLPATTTTLTSSLDPSTVGQPVTFTAVLTSAGYQGTPTGTVVFTIDGQTQPPYPLPSSPVQTSGVHLVDTRGRLAHRDGVVPRRRQCQRQREFAVHRDRHRPESRRRLRPR